MGCFPLQVAKLLIGPIASDLCFLLGPASLCLVHGLVGTATQCSSTVRSPSPQRLPVPARAWTSPGQTCHSSRASCGWLPSACALSSLSLQEQLRITHCKICWTAVRRRELPFSGVILQELPEMLHRLDKFDLVTHSKEHSRRVCMSLVWEQCSSWPVMDLSPCSATSETPAMAHGTKCSSAV